MAPDVPGAVRRVAFLMLALCALAVEIAAVDVRPVWESLGLASIWIGAAALVAWRVPVPQNPRAKPPAWVSLVLIALAAGPFALPNYPLELQMVLGLRNVGLGLAACAGWVLCLRLACVSSLFLILFAAAMTNHPAVLVLLGLYTASGGLWLTLAYWTGLRAVFATSEREVRVEVRGGRVRPPWVAVVAVLAVVGCTLGVVALGPKWVVGTLGELMPTSGGTGNTDPFARYGVGDGPEEVRGDNAKAAGMVETDKMIEDNKNSLIDAVNDMYGPPHKPPKEQERMVAAGKADVIQNHGKLPENRSASGDFDTSRKGPKNPKTPGSGLARGLFEIEGRTPLHVRRVVYETYDATAHRWREGRKPQSRLLEADGGDWMRLVQLREPRPSWYSNDDSHKLKAATLRTNLLPAPPMLTRVRINKVDKPDYYDWDFEGVLVLAGRRTTPPGVIVNAESRTVRPERLTDDAFTHALAAPQLLEVPAALREQLAQIANEWAGHLPRGPEQVFAVVNRLRAEYTHDAGATAPDHPHPVLWFLLESRRGPDYLFGTSAALLLRALDYPTRTCLGYYAAPSAYDPENGHTPVKERDLHVWAEVQLRDGHWLVLEPTPGYDVLPPKLPFWERALAVLGAAWDRMRAHPLAWALALAAVVWAVAFRRQLRDALAVARWRWLPATTWQEQVRRAARIVERRATRAGAQRPAGRTVTAWARTALPAGAVRDAFARLAERAAYSPAADEPPDARAVCLEALRAFTVRALASAPKEPT